MRPERAYSTSVNPVKRSVRVRVFIHVIAKRKTYSPILSFTLYTLQDLRGVWRAAGCLLGVAPNTPFLAAVRHERVGQPPKRTESWRVAPSKPAAGEATA